MSDYSKRIKKVQEYLKQQSLDGFLVLTEINRKYLSGFTGSKGILVIASDLSLRGPTRGGPKQSHGTATADQDRPRSDGSRDDAVLFVDDRYTIRAKKESDLPVKNMDEMKLRGRIGVEDEMTLYQMSQLKQTHKQAKWKVTRRVVDYIRAEKNGYELKQIKKGADIIDKTFGHIKRLIGKKYRDSITRPGRTRNDIGISENEIAEEIEKYGKKLGADGLAFDSIVASGPSAAAPHHASSAKNKIKKNNFLLLDFGFVVKGYHSDFTRTLFIGRPNKKQETVYNIVLEAQRREIEKIRPGVEACEVDAAGRGYITKKGYGKRFTHCSGHGVGLEIHEAPNLCPDADEFLPDRSVVTVEPGIYLEGEWGVRIEDMVVVGKRPSVLSRVAKDFKSMIIK